MQAELAEDCKWKCEACTMFNLPHRPKCSMCETDRPVNFVIPDWYVPTDEEKRFVEAAAALQVSTENVFYNIEVDIMSNNLCCAIKTHRKTLFCIRSCVVYW